MTDHRDAVNETTVSGGWLLQRKDYGDLWLTVVSRDTEKAAYQALERFRLPRSECRVIPAADANAERSPINPRTTPAALTVNDLTHQQHVDRWVSVDGFVGKLVALMALSDKDILAVLLTAEGLTVHRHCTPDTPCEAPVRWKVERRDGWSTVTHPTRSLMLRTRNHDAAIAYADRLARQEQ